MIIWVKYVYQKGHDCFNPRGSYDPKMGIPCIFFMTGANTQIIIWIKYGYQRGHDFSITRGIYEPKGGISCIFLNDQG